MNAIIVMIQIQTDSLMRIMNANAFPITTNYQIPKYASNATLPGKINKFINH